MEKKWIIRIEPCFIRCLSGQTALEPYPGLYPEPYPEGYVGAEFLRETIQNNTVLVIPSSPSLVPPGGLSGTSGGLIQNRAGMRGTVRDIPLSGFIRQDCAKLYPFEFLLYPALSGAYPDLFWSIFLSIQYSTIIDVSQPDFPKRCEML